MIEKNEITAIASEVGLGLDTVEKDYVLGWLLHGIHNHPTARSWAFKGGTSLKKCFFETFRFSEDLDFTIAGNDGFNAENLKTVFCEIIDSLSDQVGIEFFKDELKFKIIDKGNGRFSSQGKVTYNGPLRRARGVMTVKLDLTTDEVLVLDTVRARVHHPYSDEPENGIYSTCYAFEEVVAEKIRALAQRIRPRDLYDVVHFFRNREMIENPALVLSVLDKKCQYKGMGIPTYDDIQQHEKLDELEPQWENMLAHQLPSLPPIESFWQDLEPFFNWLEGHLEEEASQTPQNTDEQVFQIGRYSRNSAVEAILHKIQFAAANRVCIKLTYHDKIRTVEPLSFRISISTGNRLFYAYERESAQVKAYSISKIQNVETTNTAYTEIYPVEISATGRISMPPLRRNSTGRTRPNLSSYSPPRRIRRPTTAAYKVQCPICQKTFPRKKLHETALNNHQNKWGGSCPGTRGYYV